MGNFGFTVLIFSAGAFFVLVWKSKASLSTRVLYLFALPSILFVFLSWLNFTIGNSYQSTGISHALSQLYRKMEAPEQEHQKLADALREWRKNPRRNYFGLQTVLVSLPVEKKE